MQAIRKAHRTIGEAMDCRELESLPVETTKDCPAALGAQVQGEQAEWIGHCEPPSFSRIRRRKRVGRRVSAPSATASTQQQVGLLDEMHHPLQKACRWRPVHQAVVKGQA